MIIIPIIEPIATPTLTPIPILDVGFPLSAGCEVIIAAEVEERGVVAVPSVEYRLSMLGKLEGA